MKPLRQENSPEPELVMSTHDEVEVLYASALKIISHWVSVCAKFALMDCVVEESVEYTNMPMSEVRLTTSSLHWYLI